LHSLTASPDFAQPYGKSRTVLANEKDGVCDCWAIHMRKRNKGIGVLLRNKSIVDSSR